MKFLYLASIRLPTEKAHGLQIMKTCEALAEAGAEVELVVPTRHNKLSDDPFTYYEVKPSFPITRVRVIDLIWFGRIGFVLSSIFFAEAAHFHKSFWSADVVYSRDALVLAQYVLLGRKLVYEAHTKPSMLSKFVARRSKHIVVISTGLQIAYEKIGIPKEKITLAADGVDLAAFKSPEEKDAARTRLGLPLDKKIALYVGRLEEGKGALLLCEAAARLEEDQLVAIIGGDKKQVAAGKQKYPKVTFVGSRPYRELANNQAAADVLVIPNTAKDPDFAKYTSPLKLFTAMASGKPIVAADVPALREILDELSATFFLPDNVKSLADVLSHAFAHPDLGAAKAAAARILVERYTWKERARKILEGLA